MNALSRFASKAYINYLDSHYPRGENGDIHPYRLALEPNPFLREIYGMGFNRVLVGVEYIEMYNTENKRYIKVRINEFMNFCSNIELLALSGGESDRFPYYIITNKGGSLDKFMEYMNNLEMATNELN